MGKFFILVSLFIFSYAWAEGSAVCRYDMKDYDSPGFGIPKRSGFKIEARFGCVYRCSCVEGGPQWKVTHVHKESHIDLAVFSEETGGAKRARWFICPRAVKPDSWSPIRDELGRIIAYNAEINYGDFPAERMSSSPEIQNWVTNTCVKP